MMMTMILFKYKKRKIFHNFSLNLSCHTARWSTTTYVQQQQTATTKTSTTTTQMATMSLPRWREILNYSDMTWWLCCSSFMWSSMSFFWCRLLLLLLPTFDVFRLILSRLSSPSVYCPPLLVSCLSDVCHCFEGVCLMRAGQTPPSTFLSLSLSARRPPFVSGCFF